MRRNIKLEETINNNKSQLDREKEIVFHDLEAFVEFVAQAIGNNCEVVLHSLEDLGHAVVKIANGHVTGRSVGSPMTDFGMEILKEADSLGKNIFGSYYSELGDGTRLKSTSMLVRNTQGTPIAMLCINIDLSVPLLDFMRGLLPEKGEFPDEIVEHFPLTLDELVERTLERVMAHVNSQRYMSPSDKNKEIVTELYKRGMFKVAGVIDIVAKKMGISRYTVYNYIREAKMDFG